MTASDLNLLGQYAQHHAEDAFAEIVRRHLNLVYSAALRQVRSPQLAEEVAQSAFTDLARSASRLKPDTIVTAWLYQVTRRTAVDVVRRETRRQLREQIATEMNATNSTTADWTHIEPLLDEAMSALDETDRAAVLLRYFENKSLRDVGRTLGTSDDAAQKRVSRAVEHLREFFTKRGVTIGSSGLVVVISANAVHAAPVGLAARLGTALLTSATATSMTPTLGIPLFMTTKLISVVAIAAALLLAGGIAYRTSRSDAISTAKGSSTSMVPRSINRALLQSRMKLNWARPKQSPTPESIDSLIAAGVAAIRAALEAPGRVEQYPQLEMKAAILKLREHYREAIPVLREALRHPDWEVRLRAAGGLSYLSMAAAEAVPDLIELIRNSRNNGDAMLIGAALASIGVKAEAVPSLIAALQDNPVARQIVEQLDPFLLNEDSQEVRDAADGEALSKAISNLTADSEDMRLAGLTQLAHLGPMALEAIPALKEFLRQPNREDQKKFAEKLLNEIDPGFFAEQEDPAFQEAQAEHARVFAEKARSGQATVQELVTALRELPQAIPAAAQALGAIGYEEMGRRVHSGPEGEKEMMSVITMLIQTAAGNQPLEARLAASDAFRELQPMQTKLLYTVEETAPAFDVISNALPRLPGTAREQIESRFGNMLDHARLLWTLQQRSGEVTDYQGSFLETYARELAKFDQRTYDEFVAAMRKVDSKFLQWP